MKILHYINNLGSGGAEKLLSDILPLMKDQGNNVNLMISNSDANVQKFEKILMDEGIRIINLNKGFYNPFQIIDLIWILKREKYDIVHAHLFPTQYWLAIASFFISKRTKFVKTEHSVYNERKQYRYLRPLETFIYNRYNSIIAISPDVKCNIENWTKHKTISTILNGVNLNQINGEIAITNLSDYSFLDLYKFNILMTGRFDGWQKDQLTLLKSLENLDENFNLYFAGEGPFLNEVKDYVVKSSLSNRVNFLGLRPDIYRLMSIMDLNVLSTNHEGLSGVVLENLASGKPFLGSEVVGVKEIVPNSKFLFQKGNSRELAEKIKLIAEDKELAMTMVAEAKHFIKAFDIRHMVDNYIKLYRSVIENEK